MFQHRSSGVLVHLSSLPGPYGIGDLDSACSFLDFLGQTEQSFWQFLPTGMGDGVFGNSPYMSLSAFAGSPLFISPDLLFEKGFLEKDDLFGKPHFSEYAVDYGAVKEFKDRLLAKSFARFEAGNFFHDDFTHFCSQHASWLDDFALFMGLRENFGFKPWYEWPAGLARYERKSLVRAAEELGGRLRYHKFVQFVFFEQWRRMRQAAQKRGIKLVGDIPIYVGLDSADVWANQSCFDLDRKTLTPRHVAGVPPDYFSETGQRWGNPLYLWETGAKPNKALYEWWRQRFLQIGKMVDVVRIDHFRGFASYWQIPAGEKTAVNGQWIKGPGIHFFEKMKDVTDKISIIAEDLGVITPDVEELRDSFGFPGMKILQFAFDFDASNSYLPHNFQTTNCVVYTGTHDNDTTLGWYLASEVPQSSKDRARRYANSDGTVIHRDFVRMAFSSVAKLAIIPLQDVLGFGSDCRMNRPSVLEGNWQWRCASRFLSAEVVHYLREETLFYARGKRPAAKKGVVS
ncbi:MAG: 4-alpha-glucanotransferase [Deltaproteobacteria bacterium]|nr:4-alpha-glucanotransferase [Deltaproteobacteria bacterium]